MQVLYRVSVEFADSKKDANDVINNDQSAAPPPWPRRATERGYNNYNNSSSSNNNQLAPPVFNNERSINDFMTFDISSGIRPCNHADTNNSALRVDLPAEHTVVDFVDLEAPPPSYWEATAKKG